MLKTVTVFAARARIRPAALVGDVLLIGIKIQLERVLQTFSASISVSRPARSSSAVRKDHSTKSVS
jgi:hypothetical protein